MSSVKQKKKLLRNFHANKKRNTADKVSWPKKTKEIELSFANLHRTVGDTVTFQWETESYTPDLSDSSYQLSVQGAVSINDKTISEKETLQDIIYFRETSKSEDMKLNASDMSLSQILQSLKNKNDCVFVANTPPRILMSTTSFINTSSNEAIVEKKVESDMVVTKVSPSVALERVGNDGCLDGYFCLEVTFSLSHIILSDLEIEVLGKGYLLMKQILKGILLIFGQK